MVKRLQKSFRPLEPKHTCIWIYPWARGVKILMWLSKDFISPSWTKLSSRKKGYCWNRIAGNRQCGFPTKPVPWWFSGKLLFTDSWTGWLLFTEWLWCKSRLDCPRRGWHIVLRRVIFIVFFPRGMHQFEATCGFIMEVVREIKSDLRWVVVDF